jgi:LEA14-like dessication related protein
MDPRKPPPPRKSCTAVLAALGTAALVSCAPKFVEPTVAIAGLESWVFEGEKSTLVFAVLVTNPNPFGGTLVGAGYTVEINGVAVGAGELETEYAVPPADTVRVLLPLELDHLAFLTSWLAGDLENPSYALRGTARLETAVGLLERPFEKEERVNLRQLLENVIR